jgi:hypothetical protein
VARSRELTVAAFERDFAGFGQTSEAISVNSGNERAPLSLQAASFRERRYERDWRFAEWFRQTAVPDSRG